jgi:6-phosphogluconolactonase (cycloisomerase 2 family)
MSDRLRRGLPSLGFFLLAALLVPACSRPDGSPNDRVFLLARVDNSVKSCDIDWITGELKPNQKASTRAVADASLACMDVTPDGTWAIASSAVTQNGLPDNLETFAVDRSKGGVSSRSNLYLYPTIVYDFKIDASGKFLFAAQQNSIGVYAINAATGALTPVPGSPFAYPGPFALSIAVHPTTRFAYVADQNSNNVSGYSVDPATGAMSLIEGVPAQGPFLHSLAVDPKGRFLYVSNRESVNPGRISAFSINPGNGTLTPVPGSPFPTGVFPTGDFGMDPDGKFLYVACLFSLNLWAYAINGTTGALTVAPGSPYTFPKVDFPQRGPHALPPNSAAVDPTGAFLYVTVDAHEYNGVTLYMPYNLWAFRINRNTGALQVIEGSPYDLARWPVRIRTSKTK